MLYSTNNMLVSLSTALATELRGLGYAIYWQATRDTDAQTVGASPVATVTLTPTLPLKPSYLVTAKTTYPAGLNGDTPDAEQIVVPALSLMVGPRAYAEPMEIGHADRVWEREVTIYGFAHDAFQQRDLLDALESWLRSEESKEFPCFQYDVDPTAPPPLDPCWVDFVSVETLSFPHNEAVRYGIRVTALVHYVE